MIEIKNLHFSYKNKILYKNFDMDFHYGHIYGLLGKNASGKTTLLNLIAGGLFLKDGTISTLGYNPKERYASMLNKIFYLPEQFILPAVSTKTYIKMYAVFYPNFDISKFYEHLKAFEVEEIKKLDRLSMGQQKKFLLSFGLAAGCPINLLDEPSNGLDIPSKTIFRKLIASSANKDNLFIIATHQIKDVEKLIDHICIVDDTRVALDCSIETLSHSLEMRQQSTINNSAIYHQEIGLGEYAVVLPNKDSTPKPVDLELLFNATLTNREAINKIIKQNKEKYNETIGF